MIVSCMPPASRLDGVDDVVAAKSVERQPVVGRRRVKNMFTVGLQAEHLNAAGIAGDTEHVGAVGGVDGDRVDRAVAAAVRASQVDVDLGDIGAAEVADDDVVGAAERAELDRSRRRPGPW